MTQEGLINLDFSGVTAQLPIALAPGVGDAEVAVLVGWAIAAAPCNASSNSDVGLALSADVSSFSVEVVRCELAELVIVHGELDLDSAPRLQVCLDGVIDSTVGDVHVDLEQVGYIDSTGLAILLAAHQRLAQMCRHLIVRSPSVQVDRLLEICRARHLLGIGKPEETGWLNAAREHSTPTTLPDTAADSPRRPHDQHR